MRSILQDSSVSAWMTGVIVVLVGYASSVAIVFQAALHLGANPAQTESWMWALGIGMGISCIAASWYYRKPVVTAWSTPGAALIVGSGAMSMEHAVGAFIVSGVLLAITGFSGAFERIMQRVPMAIACAMLVGLLLRFGIQAFSATSSAPFLVISMFVSYLVMRRVASLYAVPVCLLIGVIIAFAQQRLNLTGLAFEFATPVWITPQFSWGSVIGLALPLWVVTMASQNAPGIAAIRAAGYDTPTSATIGSTGVISVLLASFGGYAFNLAAITATIAMGANAHPDPARRYIAGISTGVFYVIVGLFGGMVGALLARFPSELIAALAGFALISTIANNISTAMADLKSRDAALVTLLITASGVSFLGVGSAFWGLLGGLLTLLLLRPR